MSIYFVPALEGNQIAITRHPELVAKCLFIKANDSRLVEFYVTKSKDFPRPLRLKEIIPPHSPFYLSDFYTLKMLYTFFFVMYKLNNKQAFLGLLLNASHSIRQ